MNTVYFQPDLTDEGRRTRLFDGSLIVYSPTHNSAGLVELARSLIREAFRGILKGFGCDLDKTYFDMPRMRTVTSDGYLTSGIAYAFHPYRDTWYSAPLCHVNWWLQIFDLESGRSMAFHPHYGSQPVENSSRGYNYAEWNRTSRRVPRLVQRRLFPHEMPHSPRLHARERAGWSWKHCAGR